MSAKNGDRSRYHRLRKAKLARREQRRAAVLAAAPAKIAATPAS